MIAHFGRVHELKTWPEFFWPLLNGKKTAEYRKNDRNFAIGDTLRLREWSPDDGYSGREACAVVTHITDGELMPAGYVMLSLGRVSIWHNSTERGITP